MRGDSLGVPGQPGVLGKGAARPQGSGGCSEHGVKPDWPLVAPPWSSIRRKFMERQVGRAQEREAGSPQWLLRGAGAINKTPQ